MSGYTRQTGNESPDIADVILNALRAQQLEINTCTPGEIVSYDSTTTTCTVQPAYKRIMVRNREVVSRAQISDVPVVFPRSGIYAMTFPISQGDQCMIMYSQRSLDDWLNIGGEVTLRDTRLHDITDAIVIPGLVPRTGVLNPPPAAGMEIRGDKVFLGDPTKLITPIATAGAGAPGTLVPTAPTVIPVGKLDIIQIVEAFMTLMHNATYGGAPTAGGGGMDSITQAAVNTLIGDLGGLKL